MPPQDANPTPSFGGFGLKGRNARSHRENKGSKPREETTSLQPISRSDAVAWLAGRSLNLYLFGKDGFDVIYRVVQRAMCYDLVTNDLARSVSLLDTLLSDPNLAE